MGISPERRSGNLDETSINISNFFQDPQAKISIDRFKGFASTVSERFFPVISLSISSYCENYLTLPV